MQKNEHDDLMNILIAGDYTTMSDDDLIKTYKHAKKMQDFYKMMQLCCKLLCNSVYGGFGTASLRYFLQAVASDITAEGRNVTQLVDKMANQYFQKSWQKDSNWFNELKDKFPNIIPDSLQAPHPIKKDICIYADTDSVVGDSILRLSDGRSIKIEDLFKESKYTHTDHKGNEFATPTVNILNYTKDNELYYAKPKHIVRHKVSKAKWKLKTKSGKEIIVTNDHSMIVFRSGEQLTVKPSEILKTDKILVIKDGR
ncbi:intein-containing split DNA polymerase precursor [Tenacibaculum phage PTm5]|nr:intein-containing split DNA polymerase precursor [Tenacibaculum phage PTm5]